MAEPSEYLTYDEMTDEQRRGIVEMVRGSIKTWGLVTEPEILAVARPKPKRYVVEPRIAQPGEPVIMWLPKPKSLGYQYSVAPWSGSGSSIEDVLVVVEELS